MYALHYINCLHQILLEPHFVFLVKPDRLVLSSGEETEL